MAVNAENVRGPSARWRNAVLPGDFGSDPSGASRTLRDWGVDTVVFLITAGAAALIWYDQRDHLPVLNAVAGAVATIALWWRRSRPWEVGLLAAVAACISGPAGAAWLVTLYNGALRLERRQIVSILLIGTVGLVVNPLLYPTDSNPVADAVFCIGVVGLAIGMGLLSRARREHVLALAAAADVAESEQRLREEHAREAERMRIAREMHDVLGHRLTLLSLHAGALEYRGDASADEIAKAAGVIRAASDDALRELREVIGVMRTEVDSESGPPQPELRDVPALVEQFRDAGMRVELIEADPQPAVSTHTGRTIYRVVQEGLVNASKHSPGAKVTVTIAASDPRTITASVENGLAFSEPPGITADPGVGLIGLVERIELAGGVLEHGETDRRTFRLAAEVPIDG